MSIGDADPKKGGLGDTSQKPRRKFKLSELPLSTASRSAIDGLVVTTKKKGDFDWLRKTVWSNLLESQAKAAFSASLTNLAESEIERDPSLLSRDRGKAATLIEGAVDRTNIYKTIEADIDALIQANLGHVEAAIRQIREQDVGVEVAAKEKEAGSKTEEDYAREAEARRAERQKIRDEELARRRAEEQEQERIREELKAKKREEERQQRERERQLQREEEQRRDEDMKKREGQDRPGKERPRADERERELNQRLQSGKGTPNSSNTPDSSRKSGKEGRIKISLRPEEEKVLEEEALNLLLKESQAMAAKPRPRPDPDRSDSLEPPPSHKYRQTSRPVTISSSSHRKAEPDLRRESLLHSSRTPLSRLGRDRSRSPARRMSQFDGPGPDVFRRRSPPPTRRRSRSRTRDSTRERDDHSGGSGRVDNRLDTPPVKEHDVLRDARRSHRRSPSRSRSPVRRYDDRKDRRRPDSRQRRRSPTFSPPPSPPPPRRRQLRRSPSPVFRRHSRRRSFSRSGTRSRSRSRTSPTLRRRHGGDGGHSRSRSPTDVDSYRPVAERKSTVDLERTNLRGERSRERSRERVGVKDKEKERDRDRLRIPDREMDREKDIVYRGRAGDKENAGDMEVDRPDIDRYIPGKTRSRSRNRSRSRGRNQSPSPRRSRSRSRSRNRNKKRDLSWDRSRR
ncbi:MAG: hypothetical protein M1823_004736 [Watsoniomyces obsoletus]|nr:MAG: hypothetical protein M1823_004736 [Watsoniomyces obsoletus]